jgi:hypothetical protein
VDVHTSSHTHSHARIHTGRFLKIRFSHSHGRFSPSDVQCTSRGATFNEFVSRHEFFGGMLTGLKSTVSVYINTHINDVMYGVSYHKLIKRILFIIKWQVKYSFIGSMNVLWINIIIRIHERSWDSPVGKVTGYGLNGWVRFPAWVRYFSPLRRIQTGSGAHPASYPTGTGCCFPGSNAAGEWSWPPTST